MLSAAKYPCMAVLSHVPLRNTFLPLPTQNLNPPQVLCFVAFALCNMDRVNMSIAILPMSQQYGWDSATVGLVQSSFFWGYLLTQVGLGVLSWLTYPSLISCLPRPVGLPAH